MKITKLTVNLFTSSGLQTLSAVFEKPDDAARAHVLLTNLSKLVQPRMETVKTTE